MSQQLMSPRPSLLDHSFYKRWLIGTLTLDELRDYACQYAHVVSALPRWLRLAASANPELADTLEAHAVEEEAHFELWSRFSSALGVTIKELKSTQPNAATAALLDLGDQLSITSTGPAVAWSFEVQAPAVSEEKLRGLKAHYGIEGRNGAEYFVLHSKRDVDHATELEAMMAGYDGAGVAEAQRTADVMTQSLWGLLSSVEHAA